jgi:hypothetical protein
MLRKTLLLFSIITLLSCESHRHDLKEGNTALYELVSFSHNIFNLDENLTVIIESNKEQASIKLQKKANSFQIKTKNKTTFLTKKSFSLFTINDSTAFKNYAKLNVFQEVLQKQNLIGLHSKFLSVNIKGEINEMLFQEGFDKRVIESNANREGIIFTYSDKLKIEYNPSDKDDKELATPINNKINQWLTGDLKTECLIDVYKYGKFLALNEAMNINTIPNLSCGYYLNPVSNLLEPFLYLNKKNNTDVLSTKLKADTTLNIFKYLSSENLAKINTTVNNHKLARFSTITVIEDEKQQNYLLENCYSTANSEVFFKEIDGEFILKNKTNIINVPVVIPSGLIVKFNPGDKIDIQKGGFFLSFSVVQMNGEKENPIEIISSDTLGSGFHVINTRSQSKLNYVNFDGLSNLDYKSWKLPSAVTFYESPVEINHCSFSNNHCEDAINIFRSTPYLFSNSTIKNTFSDAFDADFSDGIIKNCKFINSGNDAVDISGSNIIIKNTNFTNVADKALSAGENSKMTIDSIIVDGASLAVVAKDLSEVEISNSTITNSEVVYCAFQKKNEFGPSSITTQNVKYSKFKEENLIEEKSKLKVDGEKIHNYRDDVRKYLYGNEYGKKTVK